MAPRVLATVLVLPLLVAVGDCAGLFGGFLVANLTLHLMRRSSGHAPSMRWVFGDLFISF